MKKIALSLLACLLSVMVSAQNTHPSFLSGKLELYRQHTTFRKLQNWFSYADLPARPVQQKVYTRGRTLFVNKQAVLNAYINKPPAIELSIPALNGGMYTLELYAQPVNSDADFEFGTIDQAARRIKVSTEQGLHYRGCVKGDSNSIAAVSVFGDGSVMMMFADKNGNYIVGKRPGTEQYVIYNSNQLPIPNGFVCAFDHDPKTRLYQRPAVGATNFQGMGLLCRKVRLYWEANYGLYRYNFNSDLGAVQNYITGLFNIVAALFANEGIQVELAESYVWTSPDPYRNAKSGEALEDFKNRWNAQGDNFKGDLAHLIAGGRENNGGLAYLIENNLCNRWHNYGYTSVFGFYEQLPAWSWDVNAITHEIGHNLGSPHTHWCGWNTGPNGTCGAIDNCAEMEATSSCTTCGSVYSISNSGWSGTIMSYCHNVNHIGVYLYNGFGPQPNYVIRNTVMNSNCLETVTEWTGSVDSLWERPDNWSCGNTPDSNAHVKLNTGVPVFPVIKSPARAASVSVNTGAALKVKSGYSLTVKPVSPKGYSVSWPPSGKLFVTGDATTAGWMANGDSVVAAQQFVQSVPGVFEIRNIYLVGGKSLLFVPVYGSWSVKYGFPGVANANNIYSDRFALLGENIAGPSVSGFYNVYVNFVTGYFTFNFSSPKIILPVNGELFITGSATPGGWMGTGDASLPAQKFVQKNSSLYEIASIYLKGGESYLLVPVYGNWNDKYGGMGSANNSNSPDGDIFVKEGSDLKSPATTGNYKITVDFQVGRYTLTRLP